MGPKTQTLTKGVEGIVIVSACLCIPVHIYKTILIWITLSTKVGGLSMTWSSTKMSQILVQIKSLELLSFYKYVVLIAHEA